MTQLSTFVFTIFFAIFLISFGVAYPFLNVTEQEDGPYNFDFQVTHPTKPVNLTLKCNLGVCVGEICYTDDCQNLTFSMEGKPKVELTEIKQF